MADRQERKLLISEIISTRIWNTLKVVAHFILGKILYGKKWNHQVPSGFFVIVYFHKRSLMVTVYGVIIIRLKPNDPYMGRTAPLTSKRCILYI